jgi:Ssp1 endopeptidase immunity protein Rap1a
MNRGLLLSVIIALSFMPGATSAVAGGIIEFMDGNKLWELCSSNPLDSGCGGYVEGVADAMSANLPSGVAGFHACLPADQTIQQVADVVKRYLRDRPEDRGYTAASIVAKALQQAFPCPP